jgi:hypothetical protein
MRTNAAAISMTLATFFFGCGAPASPPPAVSATPVVSAGECDGEACAEVVEPTGECEQEPCGAEPEVAATDCETPPCDPRDECEDCPVEGNPPMPPKPGTPSKTGSSAACGAGTCGP